MIKDIIYLKILLKWENLTPLLGNKQKNLYKEGKGKGINFEVYTEENARKLLGEAKGEMKEYTKGYKKGFAIHGPEPNVGNDLPHIK